MPPPFTTPSCTAREWEAALESAGKRQIKNMAADWNAPMPSAAHNPRPLPDTYETVKLFSAASPHGKEMLLERLTAEDMTSESSDRYRHMGKNAGFNDPPQVYVDNTDKSDTPSARIMTTASHVPVVVINDAEHQYTAAYARKSQRFDDQQLEGLVQSGKLIEIRSEDGPKIHSQYEALATDKAHMNLPYAPRLYVDIGLFLKSDAAIKTRDGTNILILQPEDIQGQSDRAVNGMIAHELAHHRDGHTGFETQAAIHNDRSHKLSITLERQADIDGTGPSGTVDPAGLALFLKTLVDQWKTTFLKKPGHTDADFYSQLAKADPLHPSPLERIAYLTETAQHLPESCLWDVSPKPLSTPVAAGSQKTAPSTLRPQ